MDAFDRTSWSLSYLAVAVLVAIVLFGPLLMGFSKYWANRAKYVWEDAPWIRLVSGSRSAPSSQPTEPGYLRKISKGEPGYGPRPRPE